MTRRLAAATCAAMLLLAGCVPASPDVDTFDDKAMRTAGAAVSELRTVERLLSGLHAGRMLRPAAQAQLRHSEDGLGTAAKAFTELNPPPARDGRADRLGALLDDAESLVSDARTAVEREAVGDYPDLAKQMEGLATKLEALERRAS